jgi:hypothetical protein
MRFHCAFGEKYTAKGERGTGNGIGGDFTNQGWDKSLEIIPFQIPSAQVA